MHLDRDHVAPTPQQPKRHGELVKIVPVVRGLIRQRLAGNRASAHVVACHLGAV